MNKDTRITVKKELKAAIRDKKSLIMMFITPLFIPIFIFILSSVFENMANQIEEEVHIIGHNYELSAVAEEIIYSLNLEFTYFENSDEMNEAFDNGEISAFITFENDIYAVYGNPNSNDSFRAVSGILAYLDSYNSYLAYMYLLENNIDPESVFNIVHYEIRELEGSNDLVGELLFIGFVFAIFAITASAVQASTDSTAGEKEKGTLETLLTFPVTSKDLITGKYIACVIACMATALLSGILLIASLFFAGNMFEIYYNMELLSFSGATITLAFVLLVGYSLFISGVAIAIGSRTKTFKEAQGALMPLSQIPIIPMFMNMFGIEITNLIAIIPIINHTLLLNEILMGNINMLHIGLMFVSTVVYVGIVIKYIVSQYKSEKILFGA